MQLAFTEPMSQIKMWILSFYCSRILCLSLPVLPKPLRFRLKNLRFTPKNFQYLVLTHLSIAFGPLSLLLHPHGQLCSSTVNSFIYQ